MDEEITREIGCDVGILKIRVGEWIGRHCIELRLGIYDTELDQWLDACRTS